jgi:hypothetical protein
VFYALMVTITALLSTALWQYAQAHDLMGDRLTVAWRRGGWIRGLTVPVVFATSIPIAFVDTKVAQLWWILLVTQRWTSRWFGGSDEPFGPSERTG